MSILFFISLAITDSLLIYLNFNSNTILLVSAIIVTNVSYLAGILLYRKLSKKANSLDDELRTTREELSKTLKEIYEYTQTLEENNRKIDELEAGNISDQEQINEILSELSLYTNQLESIVNTIDSGICTIDKNYIIQADFNRSFKKIFGEREYWESSIFDTIFYNLDPEKKRELREFLEISFSNSATSDSMINAANPVSEFIYIYNEKGKVEEKHISMKVSRIFNEKKQVEKLMFIFTDVTLQKLMEENIRVKERKYQNELELLTNIFQYEKEFIVSFVNDLNERLHLIKDKIDSLKVDEINEETLKEIQRAIHSIKGEAFSLGFKQLAETSAEMEEYIKTNFKKPISTEQNLVILTHYTKIKEKADQLNEVARKIFSYSKGEKLESNKLYIYRDTYNEFKSDFKNIIRLSEGGKLDRKILEDYYKKILKLDWVSLEKLKEELKIVTEKTATTYGKDVEFNFIYDFDGLPITTYKLLKEVFLHLIRNSISHGIEEPEERVEKGKSRTGKINIHLYEEDNAFIARYSDDGKGLDTDNILKQAIKKGLISEDEARKMDEKSVMNLIFADGFSVKENSDMVSGTGVGMSIVKNNVLYLLHGKLTLKNTPSRGVSFTIKFPKGEQNE